MPIKFTQIGDRDLVRAWMAWPLPKNEAAGAYRASQPPSTGSTMPWI